VRRHSHNGDEDVVKVAERTVDRLTDGEVVVVGELLLVPE
jgi:hypothetical protein